MANKEEIFDKVKTALVDALCVDDDEVTEEATLVGDLGAESIDYLDIAFQLEKAFTIKIEQKEFSQNMQTDGGDEEEDVTVDKVVKFVMTKVA